MSTTIFKNGVNVYKVGSSLFRNNFVLSNVSINNLNKPRDIELVNINGINYIFIFNAGSLTEGIIIRNYYDPTNMALASSIDISNFDVSGCTGIALDIDNDYYYITTLNMVSKIKYSTNVRESFYQTNGANFHDVYLMKGATLSEDKLFVTTYVDGSGEVLELNASSMGLVKRSVIVGADHLLIISKLISNEIINHIGCNSN